MEERRTKFYSSCRDGHIEIVSLYYQFYDMMFDLRVSRSSVISKYYKEQYSKNMFFHDFFD